jgi:hypothetical protein
MIRPMAPDMPPTATKPAPGKRQDRPATLKRAFWEV